MVKKLKVLFLALAEFATFGLFRVLVVIFAHFRIWFLLSLGGPVLFLCVVHFFPFS